MPNYHVNRSINITSSIESVRTSLTDFKQWSHWSPWLIAEPDAKLKYSDNQGVVGSSYQWEGELIGSGRMEIVQIGDDKIEIQLEFITPFKSTAQVIFELKTKEEETTVTWNLFGKLPFFLSFMVKKMKSYIGMDYERGLNMLKEYIEKGVVSSSINIQGVMEQQGQKYIGIANNCAIKDMSSIMPADFKQLGDFFDENNVNPDGSPFALYTEFDIEKQHASFISAIPTNSNIDVALPFIKGETDTAKVIKVTHSGNYTYLGNGWATAMMYSRANKIKTKKSPIGIEYYLNDPVTTSPAELITEIVLPLK